MAQQQPRMGESPIDFALPDAGATVVLGAALARALLRTPRSGRVLHLQGELGAGKTTCVRSLLRALGVDSPIRSPTYTLVESYHPGGMSCVHVDLYRLGGASEVDELGLADYLEDDGLLLVEWPERGGTAVPPPDLLLRLSYCEDSRWARLEAPTVPGGQWLSILRDDTRLTPYLSNLT